MAIVAKQATSKLLALIQAPAGLNENLAAITEAEGFILPELESRQILASNIAPDLVERGPGAKYPTVQIYCAGYTNMLREKFRTFSGRVMLVIEVRVSQDRLDGLERTLQLYVDAATRVLDQNRGDWGNGLFFTGGYDAVFSPVKHGGRNFLQSAKVTLDVEVSMD